MPRGVPSIDTAALPWAGPVAVYHVTDLPENENDAVARARCSTAYERPCAPAFVTLRHVYEIAEPSSSTSVGVANPCVVVGAG